MSGLTMILFEHRGMKMRAKSIDQVIYEDPRIISVSLNDENPVK
jgi:hypothetical protein